MPSCPVALRLQQVAPSHRITYGKLHLCDVTRVGRLASWVNDFGDAYALKARKQPISVVSRRSGVGLSAGEVVRVDSVKKGPELLNLRLGYWFVAVRRRDVARFFENLHGNKDLSSCANGQGDGIRRSG